MKVEISRLERSTLKQFAEQHNLTLVIEEMYSGGKAKFRCFFDDIEEDLPIHAKTWTRGEGNTIVGAASNYATLISGREMRVNDELLFIPVLSPDVKIEDIMQEQS